MVLLLDVTQKTLYAIRINYLCGINLKSTTDVVLIKCPKQIELPISLYTCAIFSELPYSNYFTTRLSHNSSLHMKPNFFCDFLHSVWQQMLFCPARRSGSHPLGIKKN